MDKELNKLLKEIADANETIKSKKKDLKTRFFEVAKEKLEGAIISDYTNIYKVRKVVDVDIAGGIFRDVTSVVISGEMVEKENFSDRVFDIQRYDSYTVKYPHRVSISMEDVCKTVKDDNAVAEFDAKYKKAKKCAEMIRDKNGNFIGRSYPVYVIDNGEILQGCVRQFDKETMKFEVAVYNSNSPECECRWFYGKDILTKVAR